MDADTRSLTIQSANSTSWMQLTQARQKHWIDERGNVSNNPRYKNYNKREKIRAQVLREETHCWLCGDKVDTSLPPRTPSSPEVDEILPVSLGGDPIDRKNVRLAHRLCNQKRGNKLPQEAIDEARARAKQSGPLKTSRAW